MDGCGEEQSQEIAGQRNLVNSSLVAGGSETRPYEVTGFGILNVLSQEKIQNRFSSISTSFAPADPDKGIWQGWLES